jgi:hypothetical protein
MLNDVMDNFTPTRQNGAAQRGSMLVSAHVLLLLLGLQLAHCRQLQVGAAASICALATKKANSSSFACSTSFM